VCLCVPAAKKKRKKDPNAPKGALSAYIIFANVRLTIPCLCEKTLCVKDSLCEKTLCVKETRRQAYIYISSRTRLDHIEQFKLLFG
jgi:hypothetical protein